MLNWYFVTKAQYDAATTKSSEALYFLSDTKQIFRGTEPFTDAVTLYSTTKPTTPAVGRLYIEQTTLEGSVYTGTEWKTVIRPVDATVNADSDNPVSGKAVAAYVTAALGDAVAEAAGAFKDASYSKDTNKLTFTKNDGTTKEVEIDNLPVDLEWTESDTDNTGLLQLKNKAGHVIGTGINLDLERFVKSGEYDAANEKIILYFDAEKTEKVEIDASALVDIYTGEATGTATTTVSSDNKISVAVKLSAEDGNQVQAKDDGLFVAATDLSGKMDKDEDATSGNLAKFDANGNAVDAGVVAGGAALASTPNASTLATEAAVNTLVSDTKTILNASIATAQDAAEAADTKAGNAQTAADEAAAAAATEKTRAEAKEAELVAALTWKTTIA